MFRALRMGVVAVSRRAAAYSISLDFDQQHFTLACCTKVFGQNMGCGSAGATQTRQIVLHSF